MIDIQISRFNFMLFHITFFHNITNFFLFFFSLMRRKLKYENSTIGIELTKTTKRQCDFDTMRNSVALLKIYKTTQLVKRPNTHKSRGKVSLYCNNFETVTKSTESNEILISHESERRYTAEELRRILDALSRFIWAPLSHG